MGRTFCDTNLFIHLFEDKEELTERVVSLRERMAERNDELLTSTLTVGEILVRPLEAGDEQLADQYEHALVAAATILPFDGPAAREFASIRRVPNHPPARRHSTCLCRGSGGGPRHHQRPAAEP